MRDTLETAFQGGQTFIVQPNILQRAATQQEIDLNNNTYNNIYVQQVFSLSFNSNSTQLNDAYLFDDFSVVKFSNNTYSILILPSIVGYPVTPSQSGYLSFVLDSGSLLGGMVLDLN